MNLKMLQEKHQQDLAKEEEMRRVKTAQELQRIQLEDKKGK
jgi:hypothetical protein